MAKQDAEAAPSDRAFRRAYLCTSLAWELAKFGVLAPPDCRLPKGWHLDQSGVPVPSPPMSKAAHDREVSRCRFRLSPAHLADTKYAADAPYWAELFRDEHDTLRRSSRHGQAADCWNAVKRRRLWAEAAPNVEADSQGGVLPSALPPPQHEPVEEESPGTMPAKPANRASVSAAVILLDDD